MDWRQAGQNEAVPGNLDWVDVYDIARENLHKLELTTAGRTYLAGEKELTSWTGAMKPPAVKWTRSCSSRLATAVQPCSRSKKPSRYAGVARSPKTASAGRLTPAR